MGEEAYTGVVKGSPKDPAKLIVDCPAVFSWYRVDARLPASVKPEGVQVGDSVRFTISESVSGAPVAIWAEAVANKKRKLAEAAPAQEEESSECYVGSVRARSKKDADMYAVECPAVTSWYTAEAKAHSGVLPPGVVLGDVIVFSLAEDPEGEQIGAPRVIWSRRASPAERKGWIAQKAEAARLEEAASGGGSEAAEVLKLKEKLKAEKAMRLLAETEAQAARTGLQGGTVAELADVALSALGGGNTKQPPQRPTEAVGELTFYETDSAESALSLYDSVLKGRQLRVELDARSEDGKSVKVFNLDPSTTKTELAKHFLEVGGLDYCAVVQKGGGKGWGKGEGGKGEGGKGPQVCHKFQATGACSFGDSCRFSHAV